MFHMQTKLGYVRITVENLLLYQRIYNLQVKGLKEVFTVYFHTVIDWKQL